MTSKAEPLLILSLSIYLNSGAAIGNFCSISMQRHPRAERPLIDYEVATLMMSGKLLGVIFGVILNEMLPKLLLIIFMVLILSYSGMRTIRKGLRAYEKETQEMERKKLDEDMSTEDGNKQSDDKDAVECVAILLMPATTGNCRPSRFSR